jgi:hypothetical protein
LKKIVNILVFIFLLFGDILISQNSLFDNLNYQIKIDDAAGTKIDVNSTVNVRISIQSPQQLLFQETHFYNKVHFGILNLVVGQGTNTGNAIHNRISEIYPVMDSLKFLTELSINSGSYFVIENKMLYANVFSQFSLYNLDTIRLDQTIDSRIIFPQNNQILKFQNGMWRNAMDSTGKNTLYAQQLNQSQFSDTAQFAYGTFHVNDDTALFSFQTLQSNYALNSQHSINADTSNFANTTAFADSVINAWHLNGDANASSLKIGTKDAANFNLRSNSTQRVAIDTVGKVYIGNNVGDADLNLSGNNGFVFTESGTDSDPFINSLSGSVLFYSNAKGSLMASDVNDSRWYDTTKMANYSFAFGKNVLSDGRRSSIVFGDSCSSFVIAPPTTYSTQPIFTSGWSSFTFGKNSITNGAYAITLGYASQAQMIRNVAMGYKCITRKESANIAMGYMAEASGSTAASFGYKTLASGHKSMAMGNFASTAGYSGGFVYGDASTVVTGDTIKSTANNQFKVRASGGVIFYSDTNATAGVSLFPGSGSWSSLSDSLMKQNFVLVNNEKLILRTHSMKIYHWNYISEVNNVFHIGPTAQAFYRNFELGESNTRISSIDLDGVAMGAIIELNNRVEKGHIDAKLKQLKAETQECNYKLLNNRLDLLLNKLNSNQK